uniref:G-protein coupled receptors family 1 profile domain-containing protein n=1 Tax=Glossina pallidipes TaxID=7398 RepID=A0A1A9ZC48_GLOPL
MDNNRNLQQKDSRALLPAFPKVTCIEGLNVTDCGNLTFSIAKLALWYNGTKTPSDSLLEMDFEYEYEDDTWPLERIISAIVPIFFGIIGFAGLLGNALVILVVMVNQQMRSTTNLLIINLAVSDILFVIFCVPFTATDYMLPEWPFGDPWCKYVQYMIVVTCHCSVYTLVLMSFDRFLAVVHPVTSMSLRTERNASIKDLSSSAWSLEEPTIFPELAALLCGSSLEEAGLVAREAITFTIGSISRFVSVLQKSGFLYTQQYTGIVSREAVLPETAFQL